MPIPVGLILAGIQAGAGLVGAIRSGRERERALGPLEEAARLQLQTAQGRGPLLESVSEGFTEAGELGAQRASRAVRAGGVDSALEQTLANQARIGGMRAAAGAVGQIQSAAISAAPQAAAAVAGFRTDIAEDRLGAASEAIGVGLSSTMRLLSRIKGKTPNIASALEQKRRALSAINFGRGG